MSRKPSRTLLVIDDDPECLEAVVAVCESEGHTVHAAVNGAVALELLSRIEPPDLILLDLMMPVMDGWQFLEARRDDPRIAPIPVVLFSGEAAMAAKAGVLGAVAHLEKPVEMDALVATIERYSRPRP